MTKMRRKNGESATQTPLGNKQRTEGKKHWRNARGDVSKILLPKRNADSTKSESYLETKRFAGS